MLVTFETYKGEKVDINPTQVQAVTTYDHFDHDMVLPAHMLRKNNDGLDEVHPDHLEKANELRTSPRTLILIGGSSFEVKGTADEVTKRLNDAEHPPAPKAAEPAKREQGPPPHFSSHKG